MRDKPLRSVPKYRIYYRRGSFKREYSRPYYGHNKRKNTPLLKIRRHTVIGLFGRKI